MPVLTYLEAIRQGIWEEMERDPSVFCLGEDIGIYGGAFKVTDGFIDRFGPERVIDTPIAESAIVGAAFGAALTGMRPVAEFQFMDFIGCAFNQIVNMVAKSHYRWGAPAPLVIRGPSGGNVHGGPFHSQNPEMWFVHAPGLKVVCPATAYDAKGLIKAAIRDHNPVIFFEHKYLYRRIKEEIPDDDYVVPIGKARVAANGHHLSVITYAAMLYTALEAAEVLSKEGIEIEVLDLRTVSPLDRTAIAETVKKTNKVIILHEHARTGGLAGENLRHHQRRGIRRSRWTDRSPHLSRFAGSVFAPAGRIFSSKSIRFGARGSPLARVLVAEADIRCGCHLTPILLYIGVTGLVSQTSRS